jgi:hypothetical protein
LVDDNNGELYRSTTGGRTFTSVNTGTNFFLGGAGSQGWYDNALWVNPQDPNFLIVGGIHLWRSTDGGTSFTQVSDGTSSSAHADHHIIVAHPGFDNSSNRVLYFGNDGGIYRHVNATLGLPVWETLNNNLGITQFYGAAGNVVFDIAGNPSTVIIGGTQDNGTPRFTGDPQSWTRMFGNDGGYSAADDFDRNILYGESQNLAINRSTNRGQSALEIYFGIGDANQNPRRANFIAPFVLDPSSNFNTMLAGGLSLWRSNNVKTAGIPTFTAIKDPTGNTVATDAISAIAVHPVLSAVILVGHNDGKVFRTLSGTDPDPRSSWQQIGAGFLPAGRMVTRLVIDNTRSPQHWIYATFGGFAAGNVWRSTDFGGTWASITGSGATALPQVPVRTLVFHPRNPDLLYVGTEVGLFTSEDAGATWRLPQNGPANVPVDELFWLNADLIAATHGRGVYRASGGSYVDCHYTGIERGTFDQPFKTVAAAVNAVTRYSTVWLKSPPTNPCRYNEQIRIPPAGTPNKRLELRALGGTAVVGRP